MMKMLKAYRAYIKDNPNHYWFRRKLYGWGWTPATREGWLVIAAFAVVLLLIGVRAEIVALQADKVLSQVVAPVLVAVLVLLAICYKTGEPPRWQWHLDRKYLKD